MWVFEREHTIINPLEGTLSPICTLTTPPHSQCPCLQAHAQTCALSDRTCVPFHSGSGPRQLRLTGRKLTRQTGFNPTVTCDEVLEGRRAGFACARGEIGAFGSDVGVSQ